VSKVKMKERTVCCIIDGLCCTINVLVIACNRMLKYRIENTQCHNADVHKERWLFRYVINFVEIGGASASNP
jgi:uncharacterized HAD superfamily protein